MKYKLTTLFGILTALNIIDWVQTNYAIEHGAYELNPFARWLIENDLFNTTKAYGTMLFITLSGSFAWMDYYDIFKNYQNIYNIMFGLILAVVISYTFGVISNTIQLSMLKSG